MCHRLWPVGIDDVHNSVRERRIMARRDPKRPMSASERFGGCEHCHAAPAVWTPGEAGKATEQSRVLLTLMMNCVVSRYAIDRGTR